MVKLIGITLIIGILIGKVVLAEGSNSSVDKRFIQKVQSTNSDLFVGAASSEIPIPERIALGGYFQRRFIFGKNNPLSPFAEKFKASEGQHDSIRAKSIVLEFNGTRFAFVSVDVVAISPRLKLELMKRIEDLGIRPENLVLIATHTHSGPGCYIHENFWQNFAVDTFVPEFYNSLISSIDKSIRHASEKTVSAKMSIERFQISNISENRRGRIFLDPTLTWLKFVDLDQKPIANWVIFPVHGDILNPDNLFISADIGGAFERAFEQEIGGISLFSMGAGGDVDPTGVESNFMGLQQMEEKIINSLHEYQIQPKNKPQSFIPNKMTVLSSEVKLPPAKLDVAACSDLIAPFRGFLPITLPDYFNLPASLTGIVIDDEVLIFIPGEPFVEMGWAFQKIAKNAGFQKSTIISLANSYYGYIMDEDEYNFGGYETCNSFYGAKLGEKIIEGVQALFSHEKVGNL